MEFFQKWKYWLIGMILIAGSGAYYLLGSNGDEVAYKTASVEKGNVQELVTVTGTVEADPEIELRFQQSGIIKRIPTEIGELVKEGALLAELQNADEFIQVEQAKANLNLANASLRLKKVGASKEDVAVSAASVESAKTKLEAAKKDLENVMAIKAENIRNAEIAVADAKKNLENKEIALKNAESSFSNTSNTYSQNLENSLSNGRITIEQSFLKIKTAMNAADAILGIDNTTANDDFEAYLGATNQIAKTTAENGYRSTKTSYDITKSAFDSLPATNDETNIMDMLTRVSNLNIETQKLLNDTFTTLEYTLTSTSKFSLTDLEAKKTEINTEKTNLNTTASLLETARQNISTAKLSLSSQTTTSQTSSDTAKANLEAAQNKLSDAENKLQQARIAQKSDIDSAQNTVNLRQSEHNQAQAAYNFKIAKARPEDLAGLVAQVTKAQADLKLAQSNLDKTKLTAPATGVVSKINKDQGENITTTEHFMTLISDKIRIIANISEVDITKIHLNDPVEVTLDALPPDRKFKAHIDSIDPAETLTQGVVYYQVRVFFDEPPTEIKPGMTANLEIIASKKDDVLTIPTRAIKYSDEGKYVEIPQKDNTTKRVFIKTGLEGDINTEVLEGLDEEQVIILNKQQ